MLKRQHIGESFAPFWNMAAVFGTPKAWFFNKKSNKVHNRVAKFVTSNNCFETDYDYITRITKMGDNKLILLYKNLKGAASIPTDDLIPKLGAVKSSLLKFSDSAARPVIYKGSLFPQTIRDWNVLQALIITSAEGAEDGWLGLSLR